MINEVKISSQFKGVDSEFPDGKYNRYNDAFITLTAIITDVNQCSERYCVVVQIIKRDNLPDSTHLTKKIKTLIQSLTKRETQVYELAIKGLANKLIAQRLFITVETVKSHRKNIISKAGVKKIGEIKDWLLEASDNL